MVAPCAARRRSAGAAAYLCAPRRSRALQRRRNANSRDRRSRTRPGSREAGRRDRGKRVRGWLCDSARMRQRSGGRGRIHGALEREGYRDRWTGPAFMPLRRLRAAARALAGRGPPQSRHRLRPRHAAAHAQPLGQSRWPCRARLFRALDLRLVAPARAAGPADDRLCPRQCLGRHQRLGGQQCQRHRLCARAALYREAGPACRRLAALWHPGLPLGPVQRAEGTGRVGNRRPPRSRGARLVGGQGRRDLRRDPRFRRFPGQGQQRGPARTSGLWPHPCRGREHDGRGAGRAGAR